jgi:hypothetical protein
MYKPFVSYIIDGMRHVDASEARRSFSRLYHEVAYGGERVIVENHGKGLVALVPVADLERLRALDPGIPPRQATVPPELETCLTLLRRERPALERAGVRHAALFGSVVRGVAQTNSDVDVLVDLDPEAHVSLFDFAGIRLRLEELFGRDVDLVSRRGLTSENAALILDDAVDAF